MIMAHSLPFGHTLKSGREVRGVRVHVPRKVQNFASTLLRGPLRTESSWFPKCYQKMLLFLPTPFALILQGKAD